MNIMFRKTIYERVVYRIARTYLNNTKLFGICIKIIFELSLKHSKMFEGYPLSPLI
jgi:hypothetical protein